MNRERLELLAKRLDLEQARMNPTEHFDMDTWVCADDGRTFSRAITKTGEYKYGACGTTACAAGLATTVPELRAQGFFLDRDRGVVAYGALRSEEACAAFWDIGENDVRFLFSWFSYDRDRIEPIHVADRIRELLAREADVP